MSDWYKDGLEHEEMIRRQMERDELLNEAINKQGYERQRELDLAAQSRNRDGNWWENNNDQSFPISGQKNTVSQHEGCSGVVKNNPIIISFLVICFGGVFFLAYLAIAQLF